MRLESIHATSSPKPRPAVLFAFTSLHFTSQHTLTASSSSSSTLATTLTKTYMGFLLLLRYHPQARNCLISSHASRDFLEGRKSKGGWMGSSRKTESARKGLGKKEYISTREVEEEKRCYIIGITDCQWQHACNICAKNESYKPCV